ncbi:MAG TPA: TetR/AcrR family transcriptional regulator [Thermoanaerobaculia bacterium]|nr:TetR/AcrR family transcriptional regulator [Thermoanaerobaculia bacterium]
MVQITAVGPETAGRVLEKKREILDAAARVFRRRGLYATGMRDIAAELGMAVGNLYYYFRDKQELLAFVQQDALAGLLALADRVRGLGLRADGQLFLLVVGHVRMLNEATPGALAHLDVEALGEAWRQAIQVQRDRYERSFREVIDDGITAGVFRPADAKVAALAILGASNWTVRWFRPDGGKSAAEIGRESAVLLVRGLLAPGVELVEPPEHLAAPPASKTNLVRAPGEGASPSPPAPPGRDPAASGNREGDRGVAGGDPTDASSRPPPPVAAPFPIFLECRSRRKLRHPSGSAPPVGTRR